MYVSPLSVICCFVAGATINVAATAPSPHGAAYTSRFLRPDAHKKSPQGQLTPTTNISSPKKDHHVLPISPLEKMLQDSGPVRADGSDKFFGMENVSSF